MAKMFGAERVILYNQEFQQSLLRVFSHFQLEGSVDIYDWVAREGVMFSRGEKAAQQHCLLTYRCVYTAILSAQTANVKPLTHIATV